MNRDGAATARENYEFTARVRRLQELGSAADPSERAAVLAAKAELLARIREATR